MENFFPNNKTTGPYQESLEKVFSTFVLKSVKREKNFHLDLYANFPIFQNFRNGNFFPILHFLTQTLRKLFLGSPVIK